MNHHTTPFPLIAGSDGVSPGDEQDCERTGSRWYVVLALPRQEDRALLNLKRQGFQAFVPRREETRRIRQRFVTRTVPVFPRYLFVSLNLATDSWQSINSTFGVSRIVSFGMHPAPLPAGVAETLCESLDRNNVLQFEATLKKGDHIRLVRGPLANHLGVLQSLDEKGRIRLLMDILGNKFILTTNASNIEKLT